MWGKSVLRLVRVHWHGIPSIGGQGGRDSRRDLTCHFTIVNWHLSFVMHNFGPIESRFWHDFLHGWTPAEHIWAGEICDVHLWNISFPHLRVKWGCHLKLYFVVNCKILTKRKKKSLLVSVATISSSTREFLPEKRVGLAFPFHRRNLSDDTPGFRISVAWRRTIWSLQLGWPTKCCTQQMVFLICVTFLDFITAKCDNRVFEGIAFVLWLNCWILTSSMFGTDVQ